MNVHRLKKDMIVQSSHTVLTYWAHTRAAAWKGSWMNQKIQFIQEESVRRNLSDVRDATIMELASPNQTIKLFAIASSGTQDSNVKLALNVRTFLYLNYYLFILNF
jgi:hypothetical protein